MAINTYAFEERFGFRSPFRIGISESAKDVVLDGRVENVMIEVTFTCPPSLSKILTTFLRALKTSTRD
jgi:hypothetical protein